MFRKYVAFDIETAKILPENFGDLHDHRPLGISCMATWCSDEPSAVTYHSKNADGSPAPQMTAEDLTACVEILKTKFHSGYTIITHNGLGFDFVILAEESGQREACRELALGHVDMMYHFFCGKGFPIKLNAAAKAIGVSKPENVDGSVAPQLWRDGKCQTVLDYVAQDCRLTLDVAEASEKAKKISWITGRGSTSHFELPVGWLTVEEASNLPLPDTSWMDNPWPRSKFTNWW
jgi:RNase_H superfamily